MPRNLRHAFSEFQAGREVQSTFRRGEVVPQFTADFTAALADGEYVTGATWYCGQPQSVVMSNAVADTVSSSVKLYCQWEAGSWMKCVASTSSGAKHTLAIAVNVRRGYWFQGDPTSAATGPYQLTAVSAVPAGPTLTLTGDAPGGITGVPYYYKYTVSGGTPPVTLALSGSLPDGLAFNVLSGEITGTPITVQSLSYSIVATSADVQQVTLPDTIAISSATYANVIASQGPSAYWRFNEASGTVMAEERGLYPGVYQTTGITLGTTGLLTGDTNKSVTGAGTGRVGDVANSMAVWSSEDVTITVLFKAAAIGTMICLVQQPDAPYYGTTLSVDDIGALVGTYVSQNSGTGTVVNVTGPNKVVAGNIYHLVYRIAKFDSTHAVTDFFLNGANISTQPAQDRRKPPNSQLSTLIGAFNLSGLTNFLNGTEDELSVFPRALTDAEILLQYNKSKNL